jgi:Lon protease-like protein
MAEALEELPLFPLNTVLFPYAQLQLHIFEPRYRELVDYCIENDTGFGVVLEREGAHPAEPYLVGTVVRISGVQPLDDGKLDVRVQGQRRFRIRKLDEDSKPFLVGHVEPIVELEVEDTPRTTALTFRLKECVEEYIRAELRHYDFRVQQINLPSEPTALSFVVANLLKIENLDKQRLLETTDTVERIAEIVPILEQQIVDAHTSDKYRVTAEMMSEWVSRN